MSEWALSLPGFGDPPKDRTLYYGDCYDWMQRWDSESVDLIYLDPPFNSNQNYNVLYRDRGAGKAQYRAFDDTWHWNDSAEARLAVYRGAHGRPAHRAVVGLYQVLGPCGMLSYLTYMAERLEQMKRILKPTGSIYLHCDPTASHYLRVIMDAVFGVTWFRNEIVWSYGGSGRGAKAVAKQFPRNHDVLLYYRDRDVTYNPIRQEVPMKRGFQVGEDGRAFKTAPRGDYTDASIARLEAEGRIHRTRTGRVRIKYFLPSRGGTVYDQKMVGSVWPLPDMMHAPKTERLNYPTQKPLALLERIIQASTKPGDLVLDPFCGCGTAVDAANRLDRRWAGIDISSFAIDLICERRMPEVKIKVEGTPLDFRGAEKLAKEKPFQFETWAIMRIPGFKPNNSRGKDGGVDGEARLAVRPVDHPSRLALAQVKGGKKFVLSQLRDFLHVTNREKAALGVYVTLNPVTSQDARVAAHQARTVRVGAEEYPRCQLWSIADHFEGRRPHLPTMTDPYNGKPLDQGSLFA